MRESFSSTLVLNELWSLISDETEVSLPHGKMSEKSYLLLPKSFVSLSKDKHVEELDDIYEIDPDSPDHYWPHHDVHPKESEDEKSRDFLFIGSVDRDLLFFSHRRYNKDIILYL